MADWFFRIANSPDLWIVVLLVTVLFVFTRVKRRKPNKPAQACRFSDRPELNALGWFAVAFFPIYAALFVGNLFLLYRVGATIIDRLGDNPEQLRWYVLAFVGLMTTLGGILGTPLALIRVYTTERQTKASEESLTTDRINKAVEGLGTLRQETRILQNKTYTINKKHQSPIEESETRDRTEAIEGTDEGEWKSLTCTMPNLEVRIGSLYALERISQDSDRDHVRILEIVTAYLRENSSSETAARIDNRILERDILERGGTRFHAFSEIHRIAKSLPNTRTDIISATRILGDRKQDRIRIERDDKRYGETGYRLNLRDVNLQGVDMRNKNFAYALMERSYLDGANLRWADFSGANLRRASMRAVVLRNANLVEADMRGSHLQASNFRQSDLSGADLRGADLSGANFEGVTVNKDTKFDGARVDGAAFRNIDLTICNSSQVDFTCTFSDSSAALPSDRAPNMDAHPKRKEFNVAWADWLRQKEIVLDDRN